ncbi:hypothetical protein KP79_PYT09247 [Mizuhopecten yessoensis]|uniref:WW domain-containing protein n=1 Tax=Mizuhopecten yessoensis TaxID=6573 RepID=A0A210PWJ4_MIZYE|nr:hypothetical protein KP79_PYT09247 [Mizuhopecten yessoensis]
MAASKQVDTTDQQETPLPLGWRKAKAVTPDRRARFYFVNHNDCYTTWSDPRIYDSEPVQQEQSVLEYIIRAYDFLNAKHGDRDRQRQEFENNCRHYTQVGNEESIQACLNALQEQICVKNFPPPHSVPDEMVANTFKQLQSVIQVCIREGRVTQETCQDLLFEFLLSLLRYGPGSSASYFIGARLIRTENMEEYFEALNREGLTRMIDSLKEWHYVHEDPKKFVAESHSYYWGDCIIKLIKIILGNYKSDKVYDPEIHQQFLDLYLFYFTKINEVPDDFVSHLQYAMKRIATAYPGKHNENPYQVLQKPDILQRHWQTVGATISSNTFREKHIDISRDIVNKMVDCIINKRWTVDLLDDIIDLMKGYFLTDHGHMHKVLSRILHLLKETTEKTYDENPQIMNKMLAMFQEVLQKKPEHMSWAYDYVTVLSDKSSARKGTEQVWFPLMKVLMRTMHRQGVYRCCDTFSQLKFKKIWNWKQNYQEALDIIEPIGEAHLHLNGDDYDERFLKYCGDTIRTLLDQFKFANIPEKLNGRVAELAMTFMEKRSKQLNRFVGIFIRDVTLEGNQDVIPGLMKRFAVLFYDRDYMYMLDEYNRSSFACSFMENAIGAYSFGKEIPDDVNKTFVEMFLWVMQTEDLEYTDMNHSDKSLYGRTASRFLEMFTSKHIGRHTSDILLPLMPALVKQMKHEEKELVETTRTIVCMISIHDYKLLEGHLEALVEWYKETQSDLALRGLWKPLEESDGFTTPDFYVVMKSIAEDTSNSKAYLHGMLLKLMAERQAELFTQEHVDMMIRRFLDEKLSQGNVLMALGEIMAIKPEIFGDNMIKHVLQNPNLDVVNAFSVHVIAVNLGLKKKDLVNTIFEELLALAKSWYNPNHQIYLLDSVRILGSKYGVETLRPHRKYFEELQKYGMTSPIKDTSAAIVNAMDGISMEGVITDVIQTKRKAKVLDEKVKKAETEVSGMKTTVVKQSKDIKAAETGLKTIEKTVDVQEREKTDYADIARTPEGKEEAHQLEETQACTQKVSLPKSGEKNKDEQAKCLEDDDDDEEEEEEEDDEEEEEDEEEEKEPEEELPPSYNSLFSQASSTQTTTKMKPSPKSTPQSSKKSSQPPPPPYPYRHLYVETPSQPTTEPEPEKKKKTSSACVIA